MFSFYFVREKQIFMNFERCGGHLSLMLPPPLDPLVNASLVREELYSCKPPAVVAYDAGVQTQLWLSSDDAAASPRSRSVGSQCRFHCQRLS